MVWIAYAVLGGALVFAGQSSLGTDKAVQESLLGNWTGNLEYRDYSDPGTSNKRVQLPTWLTISRSDTGVSLHYIYDDGPGKVVDETEQLTMDAKHSTYTTRAAGQAAIVYRVVGFEKLRDGLGTLVLTGMGKDNDKPAEERITFTIRRNFVEWLLEVRPSGSSEELAFRHLYRFTRRDPPVTKSRK